MSNSSGFQARSLEFPRTGSDRESTRLDTQGVGEAQELTAGDGLSELDEGGYPHDSAEPDQSHQFLFPIVTRILKRIAPPARILELGCGNGSTSDKLAQMGYQVIGVDPSRQGIAIARAQFPNCHFEIGSAYDDLAARFGTFDAVISLEVVEHVFYPRKYAMTLKSLLRTGSVGIVSTPYHGYLKNLTLALLGGWNSHLSPLWDYGHIKFWSRSSLARLFAEVNLSEVGFYRVGRIPPLARSMIMVVQRKENDGSR